MAWEQSKRMLFIMVAIGLALVGNAVWNLFLHPTDLNAFTATAEGTIVRVTKRYSDDDTYYRPTISFTDSDHRSFESASVVEYTRRHKVGSQVTVRYDPFHPANGCVIQGDEGRLLKKVVGNYVSLVAGIAIIGWTGWSYVRQRRLP